ncbi:glycoside hydrolase family 6 protein, partial [Serendipita vermifera MAFF 305830]
MIQSIRLLTVALWTLHIITQPASAANPYTGRSVWNSETYASQVKAAAAVVSDSTLQAKMIKVASFPTFTWLDKFAKVADLPGYLTAAGNSILQLVIYDLPNRDCHATTSLGEYTYANGGAVLYQQFIDSIVTTIKASPSSTVVAVVEPNSLVNLIVNLSDARCASVATAMKASITYACQALTSAGVYVYLDGSNSAFLGWPANLPPAAALFASFYKATGSSPFMRGIATDVGGYNALTAATPDPVTSGSSNYDESHYINALAPLLASNGWNAGFIVDQGRSGVQNIRTTWTNTCNLKGAGLGIRPTTS